MRLSSRPHAKLAAVILSVTRLVRNIRIRTMISSSAFFGQLQLRPFFEHADSHQNLDLSRLEDAVRVSRESVL